MSKLESALISLNQISSPSAVSGCSPLALLLVTISYLVAMLSVSLQQPQVLIWFALYPVVQSEISGLGFAGVFAKSLWVLPLIVLIGIFNPFLDTRIAFAIGEISISSGWISFFSIVLRGLMGVQAIIILARCVGFYEICGSMRKIGVPKIMVSQMQFTYRYIIVIIEEAINMDRARKARGFGKKNYPLKLWGVLIGQLLIRSYERAKRIHMAMLARGFDGVIRQGNTASFTARSFSFLIIWLSVFFILRFFSPGNYFNF